jgi:phosphotransferase system enzyme I (PtsP)
VPLSVAKELLAQVMELDDAQSVRNCVDMALYNAGVDRLLRTSRNN